MNDIKPLSCANFNEFKEMFYNYLTEDLNTPLTDKQLEEKCSMIKDYMDNNIVYTDLLFSDGEPSGFVSYQIDSSNNEWCEKEGWGFIKDLYINSNLKYNILGSLLATHSEDRLYKLGAKSIYLTTNDSKDFWTGLGYEDSGEVCTKNKCPIFYKMD